MKKIIVYGRAALVVVAIACVFDLARAAEPSQSADEAAIRKATADYLEARKRGDFDAIRAFWTATGNIVDETGRRISVRDIQPPASTDGKDTIPPVEIKLLANSIHFVTPNVAIEDGTSDSGSGSNGTTTRGRFSAVWVKQNGKWLIDSLREAAIADQPTTNSLQSLEWLIGNWVEPEDATAFMASFKWSEGKHYLIGEVRIQPRGQEPHVVSQRIAWDAAAGLIRSWNFDSDGGFSSGEWSRDGDGWIVSSSGVLPDGKRTLGRRVFQRIDDQSLLMESLGFQVGGESLPDLRVKLIRKPAGDKSR